jgi:uncharacterized protein (TIGR03435 family)
MRTGLPGLAVCLFVFQLAGQTTAAPPANGPQFDVVSIRINDSGMQGGAWSRRCDGGRWTGKNVDLETLITSAYGLLPSQVQGIPNWNLSALHQFDIVATCPEGTVESQVQPMLQAMLADRFGLSAHFETREMGVRTLELAKDGPKLKPASGNCVDTASALDLPEGQHRCGQFYATHSRSGGSGPPTAGQSMLTHYHAWSATTADFVKFFGRMGPFGQPPMIDETGLTGKYDFDFQYELLLNEKDADGKPIDQEYRFVQAVEHQLGLVYNERSLKKEPVPVLIIDRVSMPSPN